MRTELGRGSQWLSSPDNGLERIVGIILLVLLLALIFGGLGFAVHALWIIAFVLLVVWLLGFIIRGVHPIPPHASRHGHCRRGGIEQAPRRPLRHAPVALVFVRYCFRQSKNRGMSHDLCGKWRSMKDDGIAAA